MPSGKNLLWFLLCSITLSSTTRSKPEIASDAIANCRLDTLMQMPSDADATLMLQVVALQLMKGSTANLTSRISGVVTEFTRFSVPSGSEMLHRYQRALQFALTSSFVQVESKTSKSGASFYWSKNRKFLLKAMPSAKEFAVLGHLAQDMGKHFAEANYDVLRTSLNPTLLSFSSEQGETKVFWALLVVESGSMIEAASGRDFVVRVPHESEVNFHQSDGSVQTLKMPAVFDVKPLPIGSVQRKSFFQYIEVVTNGNGLGQLWENHEKLQVTVLRDLQFLEKHHLVDYSILATFHKGAITRRPEQSWNEVYVSMGIAMPRCTWLPLRHLPNATESSAVFMCFSIIDYLMDMTTLSRFKQFENLLLGLKGKWGSNFMGKWNQWGNKVQELFVCTVDPCAKATKEKPRVYHVPYVGDVMHINGCKKYRDFFASKANKKCVRHQDREVDASIGMHHVHNPFYGKGL